MVAAQLPTLAYLEHAPSARTALSIFNSAQFLTVDRETDINNFEVNLLNNGGYYQTRRGIVIRIRLIGISLHTLARKIGTIGLIFATVRKVSPD